MLEKYLNNNLEKPKFLFHGSPKALDVIVQNQAHDSNSNLENEDSAVFLTSSFIIASAYAFKDKVKELSRDLDWSFEIGGDVTGEINIDFNNVRVQDDLYGYIYVLILMIVMSIMVILSNINVIKILSRLMRLK